jgi:hypothetical protein
MEGTDMPASDQSAQRHSHRGAQIPDKPLRSTAVRSAGLETHFLLSVFAELTGSDRPTTLQTRKEIE